MTTHEKSQPIPPCMLSAFPLRLGIRMTDTKSTDYKAGLVAGFIAQQHAAKAQQGRPLLVSMQGPQGAGGCGAAG